VCRVTHTATLGHVWNRSSECIEVDFVFVVPHYNFASCYHWLDLDKW
jgi:hypothetical protein